MTYLEPYIEALFKSLIKGDVPDEIDLILEGGSFNCSYHIGILTYLRYLEEKNITKIRRISGVSGGALIGFMYLINNLNKIDRFYNDLTKCFSENGNLKKVFELLDECLEDMKDKDGNYDLKKINKKLYISYIDIKTCKRVVISEFNSIEELKNALLNSSHLPFIINGKMISTTNGFDGGLPYIFPINNNKMFDVINKTHKTLYINLTSFDKIKGTLSTVETIDGANRAVEGIQQLQNLFKTKKNNKIASYVEDWNYYDYSIQSFKYLFWWIIVIIIEVFDIIIKNIPSSIKENGIIKRLKYILYELWIDYGNRIIQL